MPDYIMTRTGQRFHHAKPDWRTIRIEDIAHSLGHQCRFLGHTDRFWATAQHSIEVSLLCSMWAPEGDKREAGLAGLLHDAHEAYIGDFPTPFKQVIQEVYGVDFAKMEADVIAAVHRALGTADLMDKHAKLIKHADRAMLYSDAMRFGMDERREWVPANAQVFFGTASALKPEDATQAFIERFLHLGGANRVPSNPSDEPGTPYALREAA